MLGISLINGDKKIRELIIKDGSSSKENTFAPKPIARWTFDVDLKDQIGNLHGKAINGAKIHDGALELDGKKSYVMTNYQILL